jgi:hypothetical protein
VRCDDGQRRYDFAIDVSSELAYEVHDYIDMVVPLFPHRSHNIKREIAAALCFHHAASLVSVYHIFETDFNKNSHFQWVSSSLVLGGAVSCILETVVYSFDVNSLRGTRCYSTHAFLCYDAFVSFPVEGFRLIRYGYRRPHVSSSNPWGINLLVFDALPPLYSI